MIDSLLSLLHREAYLERMIVKKATAEFANGRENIAESLSEEKVLIYILLYNSMFLQQA